MNLNPDQARRLAKALLDDSEDEADQTGTELRGRLTPGPFGHYTVRRLVGLGGMGEVYEAQQENPDRRVAIKVVRPDLISPEALRRFEHETRILARLQHPGISPIYEAGRIESRSGSTPFFAMEFVEGKPLTAHAAELKLSIRQRLELFLLACDAVEHAHRKGVIHRDLKPANILVDSTGRPRVMDFGVARATDSDIRATTVHTEIGKLVGTLPYMSPEQVGGHPDDLDTRSDVYSLGVVLYELLGGKLPYDIRGDGRGRIPEAVRAIQESEPAPLSSIDRVFRGDLDTIVAKALAKEKERRYQSVGELAADIRRHLDDEPIEARRPSTWYQIRKFARRNRGFTGITLGSALLLASATAAAVQQAVAANAARAREATHMNTAVRRGEEALLQADNAKATLAFVVDMLRAQSPSSARGRNPTVKEVLNQASDKVGTAFPGRPGVESAVRLALGCTYHELGEFRRAEEHLEHAVELGIAAFSEVSTHVAEAKSALAETKMLLNKPAEAERLRRECLAAARQLSGEANANTIIAKLAVAEAVLAQRRFAEAEALIREALAADSAGQLSESLRIDKGLATLAFLLIASKRFEEAEPVCREVYNYRREHLGDDHPSSLSATNNLATVLMYLDRPAEAEPIMREGSAAHERLLGPTHVNTLVFRSNQAALLAELHRPAEALTIAEDVLVARREVLGPTHKSTLTLENNIVTYLMDLGRYDEAISRQQSILQVARDALSSTDPDLRLYEFTLGRALLGGKQFEAAEPLLLGVYEASKGGPEQSAVALKKVQGVLVTLYSDWGRPEKATEFKSEPTRSQMRPSP